MLRFVENLFYFPSFATLCQSGCSSCAALWSHCCPSNWGAAHRHKHKAVSLTVGVGLEMYVEWELCYMHTNLLSGRWIPTGGWSVSSTDFSEKYYSNFVRLYISSFGIFDWILDFDILSFLISLTLSFHGSSVATVIISTLILHPDITSPTLWRYLADFFFAAFFPFQSSLILV